MVQLTDTLDAPNGVRICRDGSLVAEVFAARTGIQDYLGREVDPSNSHGLRDKASVKVYRPESEVFKQDSIDTYANVPVTIDHPSVMVDDGNWKRFGVGDTDSEVLRDGGKVRIPLIVRDREAVSKVRTTHRQVSMGYSTELVFPQDGKHPDGTLCDAYQTDIRINHLAFVPAARGGPELRIVDERPPETVPMKIKIGDAEVDATNGEAVRIAVDGLNAKLGTLTADLATANTAIQTKDGEIVALNAKLADANDPVKQAARDAARAAVIVGAQHLKPGITVDGKSDADIRKEAVTAKLGDGAKEMADAAIEGAFIALTKDAKPAPSPTLDAFKGLAPITVNDNASVRDLARASQF